MFDGVENSVFDSQVLRSCQRLIEAGKFEKVVLLSFQKNISRAKEVISRLDVPKGVEFVLHSRLPFFGSLSLERSVEITSSEIFKLFPDAIYARGPIAGYLCINALGKIKDENVLIKNKKELPELIIQAQGLLAQEYQYCNKQAKWNPFLFPVKWFIKKQLESIEKKVYGEQFLGKLACPIKIKSITQALSDYLVEEFGASPRRILQADKEKTPALSKETIKSYRQLSRATLGITEQTRVYCYNGTAKPWQCPKETIELFCKKLEKDPSAHLLIISQDKDVFETMIKKKGIPAANYSLFTTHNQADLHKLLCAADVGIIIRESHPINWVSKPIKVLDYLACGLEVEHNNTISWVIETLEKLAKSTPIKVEGARLDEEVKKPKLQTRPMKRIVVRKTKNQSALS